LVIDLESADAQRRLGAARALGRLKNRAAAAPLIAALSDPDADVANAAAHGLGVLGDPSAVEPLIVVLNNADGYFHEVVRTAGIASLGQLRDPRAVEPLQNAINDSMAETSAEAIHALAMLGDARGVASLLAVIRNADGFFLPTARRAAVVALAKLGGPQADCELKFVATNEFEDPAIRDAAIGVIAHAAPAASVN
jgi:HEAT repeat protein